MEIEQCKDGPIAELLGEIEARIVGMQYYDAETSPGEQITLEREPENPHDGRAIRVENRRFEAVGHLPRRLASWLSPLIDAGRLQVEGYVPKEAGRGDNGCPVILSVFVCEKGWHLLQRTEVTGKLQALHEVIRRACEDAKGYRNADLVLGLADGLELMGRQGLLPETRLLLALISSAYFFDALRNRRS